MHCMEEQQSKRDCAQLLRAARAVCRVANLLERRMVVAGRVRTACAGSTARPAGRHGCHTVGWHRGLPAVVSMASEHPPPP